MPRYEFECNACKENFEKTMSMTERGSAVIVCPKCGSRDAAQKYSDFNVIVKKTEKSCPNGSCCASGCPMRRN